MSDEREPQAPPAVPVVPEPDTDIAPAEATTPLNDAVAPEPISEVEAEQPLPEPRPVAAPTTAEDAIPEDITPDEVAAGDDVAETRPRRERPDWLVDVLAVSTVVLLIATVLLGLMAFAPNLAPIKSGPTRLAAAALEEQDITDVAKRFARNFLTIDYRTMDADIKRLIVDATGDFKDQIGQVLKLSRAQFEKRKATSTGKVTEAVLLFQEDTNARVQVLAERTIRNVRTKDTDERPETKVLDITLVKTSDGWKVDNVREVQVQGEP